MQTNTSNTEKYAQTSPPVKPVSVREPLYGLKLASVALCCLAIVGWLAVMIVGMVLWNRLPVAGYLFAALLMSASGILFGVRFLMLKSPGERYLLAKAAPKVLLVFIVASVPWWVIVYYFGITGWLTTVALAILCVLQPSARWVERTYEVRGAERRLISERDVPDPTPAILKSWLGITAVVFFGWSVVAVLLWMFLGAAGIW